MCDLPSERRQIANGFRSSRTPRQFALKGPGCNIIPGCVGDRTPRMYGKEDRVIKPHQSSIDASSSVSPFRKSDDKLEARMLLRHFSKFAPAAYRYALFSLSSRVTSGSTTLVITMAVDDPRRRESPENSRKYHDNRKYRDNRKWRDNCK